MATHKYRLIGDIKTSLTIITQYGDVAEYIGEYEEKRTEYCMSNIFDAMREYPHLDLWSALAQGEMFINDWEKEPTYDEIIADMIVWLDSEKAEDEWVRDDSLFPDLMSGITVEEARKTLKDKGYFVDTLWSVADVFSKVDCTEREAQVVLKNSLTSEAVYDAIWYSIEYHAEEFGEIKKKGVKGE